MEPGVVTTSPGVPKAFHDGSGSLSIEFCMKHFAPVVVTGQFSEICDASLVGSGSGASAPRPIREAARLHNNIIHPSRNNRIRTFLFFTTTLPRSRWPYIRRLP